MATGLPSGRESRNGSDAVARLPVMSRVFVVVVMAIRMESATVAVGMAAEEEPSESELMDFVDGDFASGEF
jgi:hypothetical protein